MADEPIEALGGKTPMQYAKTPYMDKLAELGVTGQMKTVADGFHPGSEVANMAVLGYDLPSVYEGRGCIGSRQYRRRPATRRDGDAL